MTTSTEKNNFSLKTIVERAKSLFPGKSSIKPEFTSENFMKSIVKTDSDGKYERFSKDYEDILNKVDQVMIESDKILKENEDATKQILENRNKIIEGNLKIKEECKEILSQIDIPDSNPLKRKFSELYDYESFENYSQNDAKRLADLFGKPYCCDSGINFDDMTQEFIAYTSKSV
jgi:predicted nuclease with TOPRIM domain